MKLLFVSIMAYARRDAARGAAPFALLLFLLAGGPQAWSQSSEATKIVAGNIYAITGVAKTATVTIRSEPSSTAPAVGTIPGEGEWIVASGALSQQGKDLWAHVVYRSMQGWIQTVYLIPEDGLPKNLKELRDQGIAVEFLDAKADREKGFEGTVAPYSNKCPYPVGRYLDIAGGKFTDAEFAISISDAMLTYFKGRGFSLDTLCLALTTEMVFDPNTGINVAGAWVTYRGRVLLNVPDCFKNGTPLLDCKVRFHWFWGEWEVPTSEQAREKTAREYKDKEALYDRALRDAIAAGKVKDGDLLDSDAMTAVFGEKLAEGMHGQNPPGGISFIEISKKYPRGYAYRIWTGHMGGDAYTELDSKGLTPVVDIKVAVPWSKH